MPSNELVAQIHDRMPLILPKSAYERWLGQEPDPHDLLVPFPAEQMVMWPVSTRVNKPRKRRRRHCSIRRLNAADVPTWEAGIEKVSPLGGHRLEQVSPFQKSLTPSSST